MKSSVSSRSARSPRPRRQVAQLLKTLFSQVTGLSVQAERLHARVANGTPSYSSLRACIEELLHELQRAVRELAARASAMGGRVAARRTRALYLARTRQKMKEFVQVPAQLAGALLAECQACGARLCALVEAAQAAGDEACVSIAYSLMRTLEKQLWLLRPHTIDTAHPFPSLRLA